MSDGWVMRAGSRQVSFGGDLSGLGLMSTPVVEIDFESEMVANPRGDGRRAGVDTVTGQSVLLAVEARPDHRSLRDVIRELLVVWRADEVRHTGGALASLTSPDGLTVYGRPRPVAPDQQYRLFDVARAELVFECVSDLWYGETISRSVRFSPVFTGGLPVTAAVPFVLGGGGGEADVAISVAGDFAAWPVFTVSGPVKDAYIDVSGAGRLALRGEVKAGQRLVVDTRPWARSVTLNGAAFPGALSPVGDRMSDMSLAPGSHLVVFGGHDPSGTSSLTVSVEQAYASF